MFAAVLDTSVLWPSLQRDFLLSLAIEGLYRPLWSSAILAELEYHEARKLVDRGDEADEAARRASYLIDRMTTAFDDALVDNWEPLEGAFGLPDKDDEHVVAAAVVGGAGAIVTDNLRDFPSAKIPRTSRCYRRPNSPPTRCRSHPILPAAPSRPWPADTQSPPCPSTTSQSDWSIATA
jgi:hypothetical protein